MTHNSIRTLAVLVFLVICTVLFSQTETMVSLLEELDNAGDEIGRVDVMNRIARKHYELNQLDRGLEISQEAYEISSAMLYLRGEAESCTNIALFNEYKNQFPEAIYWYTASLSESSRLGDSLQQARTLNNIGLVYRYLSSYDTALSYFDRSLSILQVIRDTVELANTFNLKGLVYSSWGDYEESLENFMSAMVLYQSAGNSMGMSKSYCYIGMVYRLLGEYSRAENYFKIALDLNIKSGPTRDIIDIYEELGTLNRNIGRWQDAIAMFEKSLGLARYYGNKRKLAESFDNLGLVYYDRGEYDQALTYYNRALSIRNELGIKHGILTSNINIARVYLDMAEIMRSGSRSGSNVYSIPSREKIFSLLRNSLEMALEYGYFNDLERVYASLAKASAIFNNYEEAVRYQNILIPFKDSLSGMNQARSLAELQTRFEKGRQEQEILLLNSQHKVQETLIRRQRIERYIYMGSGVSLVLLIIGLWSRVSFINRARDELELKNVQIGEEKNKAELSEKVKDQFLAKMSHEIRIPMNTIIGSVNIILKGEHLSGQMKYLNAIRQSSENLLVIIDDILDLTRLEAGRVNLEKIPFSIAREVANIEQILTYKAAEKGIGLVLDLDENLPENVVGDPTRLSQILMNLAGNGIKFTEEGSVKIAVKVVRRAEGSVNIRFEVTDTGIGIPADRLEKIFKSFGQADSNTTRKYGGTGLGLTISKQLVEMQEGKLGVESEPGKGSRFFFELAYKTENKTFELEGRVPEEQADVLKNIRVLVVEDDEFNVMVLLDTLDSALENATLDVAEDGKKALEMWASADYDLIIMDIELPEMNGHEVTRAIRRSGRMGNGVPIVAITASALQNEMEDCFNSGMNDFISKPFDQDDLIKKINKLLIDQKKT